MILICELYFRGVLLGIAQNKFKKYSLATPFSSFFLDLLQLPFDVWCTIFLIFYLGVIRPVVSSVDFSNVKHAPDW